MRFDPQCRVPEIVKTIPHLAFAVDNLDEALEGKQILIPPNSPSAGVRVAFILDDGAPIELMEFDGSDSDSPGGSLNNRAASSQAERSREWRRRMRRWTIRTLVGLCGLVMGAALTGATYQWLATRKDLAATPPPGHLVDIGGYRLHLWCTGDGAPAVILDAGLGGSSVDWGFVQPDVARFTRVCSYDRAGMGYSDSGPSPRTARRIARELAELLARSGLSGPVVLVGESIAGFNIRVFASDHPERAAGLVLVDASHEDDAHEVPGMARFVPLLSTIGMLRLLGVSFGQRVESLAPSVQRYARATRFRAAGYQASADELIHIGETVSDIRQTRRTLTIPVLVVTGARGADENWRQLQQDQASLSERGCLITAHQSGHVVAIDEPEVVVDAIRTVVEIARGQDVPVCASGKRSP
jgi:pimeloyl-ACP methyl ester carboxylesterase